MDETKNNILLTGEALYKNNLSQYISAFKKNRHSRDIRPTQWNCTTKSEEGKRY